jgi:hypothetical protein
MKAAEEHLLIFERHFSPEKRCRPPLRWGIMPSACFSAPLPRGLVEGASAGQHVAAGAAWVDLPQANPSGRASRERASQYPQRSRPSEQRHKNRQMALALRVAEITGRGLCWLRGYSPQRGCAREAALPAAHGLPGRCFASATAYRNGLYAI